MRVGDRTGREKIPQDESKPSPRAESPPLNAEETVAPDVPQSELVLRKLEDLIKNNQVTPELEKETGMSREEMEQFVEKYRKTPKGPAGEGREIKVDPEDQKGATPQPKLSELKTSARVRSRRSASVARRSTTRFATMSKGPGSSCLPRSARKYEAYKSSLSRSPALQPARPAPATGSGGR